MAEARSLAAPLSMPVAPRIRPFLRAASPVLVMLAILVVWEASSAFGFSDPRKLSRPSQIGAVVLEWIRTSYIWPHVAVTLFEVGVGYVAGTALGMAAAFAFFFMPRVAALFDPVVVILNAAPRPILAPLFVLLFGIGVLSKIMLVILVVFIITLVNLSTGLREVDRTIVDNARVLGASRAELVRHVYVPAALVWIIGAMRLSIGQAFTTAIICELLGATKGLGWIVAAGQSAIKPEWIMAGLFFASVIVIVVDLLVLAPLERRGSHWRVF